MRLVLLIVLTCFTDLYCCAQNNMAQCSDTGSSYDLEFKKDEQLKIGHLIESSDSFHFRFRKDGQMVDLWSKNGVSYEGLITNYVRKYVSVSGKKKKSRYLTDKRLIDSTDLPKFLELTKIVAAVPASRLINGWRNGMDGEEKYFETLSSSQYCFKSYWSPASQDSTLPEVKSILKFTRELDSLLKLEKKFNSFYNSLKPGSYVISEGWVSYKATKKELAISEKYRPYRKYLKSVSDTLNKYLKDTLTKLYIDQEQINYYGTIILHFSQNNQLMKISHNGTFDDKEDKKEFLNAKKWLVAAFKKVKADFVHSSINYDKTISFYQGKITID